MMRVLGLVGLGLFLACAGPAFAQQHPPPQSPSTGVLEGTVVDARGQPVPGLVVHVRALASAWSSRVVSGDKGDFRVTGLLAPTIYEVACSLPDQLMARSHPVRVRIEVDGIAIVRVPFDPAFLEEVTVTANREEQLKRETPATIGVVDRAAIEETAPTHPGQILGRVPGVWVNVTGGEGHQTAIRQPLTSNPVYLYLEDGVPTRSTGFFNHNALYEINVPGAEAIEVTKGPGSALYGSDAIGGVVNVVTRSAFAGPKAGLEADGGEHGWGRLLASWASNGQTQGLRGDLNLTRTDGWRDATGYDRQSATVRYDRMSAGSLWKGLVTYSQIDQQTAGSSSLREITYLGNPELNLTPISYRRVRAFRASFDYSRMAGATSLSVIPFFRDNRMDLLPNWALTFDPTEYFTQNKSYGVLAKVRRDLGPRAHLLAGVDIDVSPGGRFERQIVPQSENLGVHGRRFFDYEPERTIYDYDVRFAGVSPYWQGEWTPAVAVKISAGLRFDSLRYDYDDQLTMPATARYRRPPSGAVSYEQLSPKLGVTWQVSPAVNVFGGYRHAFRAPSESQLFRQGSARDTIGLEPVKADNTEGGVRLTLPARSSLEVSIYRLVKRDDILSFRDPLDGASVVVNAGRTSHAGLEIGASTSPLSSLHVAFAWSRALHEYDEWVVDPAQGIDYSGKRIEVAPRDIGSLVVTWQPVGRVSVSAEATHVGRYWLDAANTTTYSGHTLLNLRGEVRIARQVRIFARILNATDRLYAESGSFTLARGREFAPGSPRTVSGGVKVEWPR